MLNFLTHNRFAVVFVALISGLIFIPFIDNCPLFDWDEVNFAECAREMIVSGDYSHVQLNFRPFWEKPPFFIWLQALSMNLFGVNEFAARFPNALCSIVSLLSLVLIGRKIHSQKMGLIWAFLYAGSLLPHFYFKSGIIDPWFNLFIFLAIYQSLIFLNNPDGKKEITNALLAGLFLGIAVLTKGPAALVITALTLSFFLLWKKQTKLMFSKSFLIFVAATLLVSGSWFLIEWAKGNGKIIEEFIEYQIRLIETEDSGHSGPFYYHFVVLLIGCFPASFLFLVSYFKYKELTPFQRQARLIFLALFWVVLLLFSLFKTKIIHYSSLCYYPLTFIAALGLVNYAGAFKLSKFMKIVYWFISITLTILFTAIGFAKPLSNYLISNNLIADTFAAQNLQAEVSWSGFEFLLGILFLLISILIFSGLQKENFKKLYLGIGLNIVFIILFIAIIIPKIEGYTQHAAIEFYKERAKETCYVETHGFKSYAYLFYSNRLPGDYTNEKQKQFIHDQLDVMEKEGHSRITSFAISNQLWMEHGEIDRPVYIVIKTKDENELLKLPEFEKLYHKNGFSFFRRMPKPTDK